MPWVAVCPGMHPELPAVLLQPGIFASPLGQVLLTLIGIAVVLVVGRFLLSLAWKIVTVAAVVVGLLLVLSMFGLSPV